MGFRRPLVAHDLYTSAAGRRVVITSRQADRALFYTGDTGEQGPGQLLVDVLLGDTTTGKDQGRMSWLAPSIGTAPTAANTSPPSLALIGRSRDGSDPGSALVQGRVQHYGGQWSVDRPIAGPDLAWTSLPLNASFVPWDTTVNAPLYRRDAAGSAKLTGIVALNAANGSQLNAGASAPVCQLPAGYYPAGHFTWRAVPMINASGVWVAAVWSWVTPAGVLTVQNSTGALAGGGYGFCIGMTYDVNA